jgi:hypothetical protein
MKTKTILALLTLALGAALTSAARAADITPAETRAIAEEGFIYGLPIVMNYAVMYEYSVDRDSGQFKAPFNQINNEARVFTYKDTAIITPNSDTPYSILWLDLRAEPIVLSVPAVEKERYYSVMLCDGNTFNYGYIGSRATGNDAGDYMVVGPNWKDEPPPGIKKVFRSSMQFSAVAYRTQLFNPEDMPNVVKVQAGYEAQPLSAYLHQAAPLAAPAIDFPKINKDLIQTGFFNYLDFALQFAPAGPEEKEIRTKLARHGIGAGMTFDSKDLSAEQKEQLGLGMKDGEAKVEQYLQSGQKNINGWKVGSLFGDRAFYNGDWLKRAAAAKGHLRQRRRGGHVPHDQDAGRWRSARRQEAQLHADLRRRQASARERLWSVTMYDGKTQLLIENPINRYLINSPMLPGMKKNADGSLTLYIQKDNPRHGQGK